MTRISTKKRHRSFAVLLVLFTATLPTLGNGTVAGAAESVATIEAAAHSYVESLIPPGSVETQISVMPIDRRLRLAQCGSALVAQLPVGTTLAARSTVNVSCAGPTHWSVYIPVVIESEIPVLVLRRAAARDAHLTADDVTVESRRVSGTAIAYLGSITELANRTVRRPLAIGTSLTVDMFTANTVIHRGQDVTLVAGGPAIEIRAAGRALSDAAAGARVQVQNLSSMSVVEGVVESADVVRVAL